MQAENANGRAPNQDSEGRGEPQAENPGNRAELRASLLGWAGPMLGVLLLFLFVGTYADQPEQEEALVRGGLLGLGVAAVLGFLLALWTAKQRKKDPNPLLPMAMGFLLKLVALGLGMFLLARPLKEVGSFEAYGLCFIFGAFSYQLLFAVFARPRVSRAGHRAGEEEG